LFKNYDFNTLDFFNPDLKNKIDMHSHIKLKNVKKLNILTHFIEKVYKPEIEKVINKLLIDGISAMNHTGTIFPLVII